MFKIRTGSRRIDSIFVMILFFLFALTAFVLVMIGVRQYQSTADSMNYNYEVRTATSYLREKVRQNDSHAAISIDNIEDTDVLALKSEVNGIVYYTYIYYYDGYLRELYVQDGSSYSLSTGQQIIELLEMTINILLFSALLIVGLLFFIKTHTLTEQTGILHQAVNTCSNVASIYEQEDGSLDTISSMYPGSICADDVLFIYLNAQYDPCDKDESIYKVIVSRQEANDSGVQKADIQFLGTDNNAVYSITACSYTPLTPEGRMVNGK